MTDSDSVVIGDLGCPGIDVDRWRQQNRVRLYPEQVNNWLLVRTLRDKPSSDDIKQTLFAVMNKWFAGDPTDPAIELSDGGRAGNADGIRIQKLSRERFNIHGQSQLRSGLQYPPLPTLKAGPVVYLHVTFNYRGHLDSLPWPVRSAPGMMGVQLQSAAYCPLDADWMLLASAAPGGAAPPKHTIPDEVEERLKEAAKQTGDSIVAVSKALSGPVILGSLAFAAWVLWQAQRKR